LVGIIWGITLNGYDMQSHDLRSDSVIIYCVCLAWHGYKDNQNDPLDERSTRRS